MEVVGGGGGGGLRCIYNANVLELLAFGRKVRHLSFLMINILFKLWKFVQHKNKTFIQYLFISPPPLQIAEHTLIKNSKD